MAQIISNIPKLDTRINELQGEVGILRSLVIGLAGKDKEGQYKSGFVKEILKASKGKISHEFKNKKLFLTQLKRS